MEKETVESLLPLAYEKWGAVTCMFFSWVLLVWHSPNTLKLGWTISVKWSLLQSSHTIFAKRNLAFSSISSLLFFFFLFQNPYSSHDFFYSLFSSQILLPWWLAPLLKKSCEVLLPLLISAQVESFKSLDCVFELKWVEELSSVSYRSTGSSLKALSAISPPQKCLYMKFYI